MAEEVRINLTSSADTSGIDKMGAAVGGVTGSAEKAAAGLGAASKESKQMAAELGRSVEVGSATVGLFQNIATASQGGAAGMAAAARAGLGFGQMLKGILAGAGPIGITLAAVGVAAGALVSIFGDSGKAAEEAKRRIEGLNKLNLDSAKEQQRLYGETIQANLTKLQAEYDALEKIADAELNRRKTAIDADVKQGKMSERQGEAAKRALDRQREDEKRSNALRLEGERLGKLEEAEAATAEAAANATDEWLRQTDALQKLASAQDAAKAARNAMLAMNGQGGTAGDYATAQARLREARAGAAGVDESTIKARRDIAESAAQAANRAEDEARAQRERYRVARLTEDALAPRINESRANEDRASIEPTEAEKLKRNRERELKLWKLRQYGSEQIRMQVARGMITADDARAAYPTIEFADGPASTRPVPALTPSSLASAQPQPPLPPPSGGSIQRGGETYRAGAGGLEKVASALKDTATATEEADTGAGTAEQAEQLKEVTEKHAAAVKESAQKTDAAMADASRALAAASGVLSTHNGRLSGHDAEFRRVWGALSALQSSRRA